MHWLQTLDTGLFCFLNQSLSNPIFDRVMPWLSGNGRFVPLGLIVAALMIWRYRVKGLFFVVMFALIVPLFCVMVIYWELRGQSGARFPKIWLAVGLVLGLATVVGLHETDLVKNIAGKPLPVELNPLRRVRGWKGVADAAGETRAKLPAEGRPVFIIGRNYTLTSQIAFHLPEAKADVPRDPLVYGRTSSRPANQYFFWPGYRGRKGQNAIYIEENKIPERPPENIVKEFESVTDLGLREVSHNGRVCHTLQIFECRNLR